MLIYAVRSMTLVLSLFRDRSLSRCSIVQALHSTTYAISTRRSKQAKWMKLAISPPIEIRDSSQSLLFSSSSSSSYSSYSSYSSLDIEQTVAIGVPRLSTFQQLLSLYGAPGSVGCSRGNGDLIAVTQCMSSTPEVISSLETGSDTCYNDFRNLHPFLFPIVKSRSSGHYICACWPLTNLLKADATSAPWSIVETTLHAPGMQIVALSADHLMKRIAATADEQGDLDTVHIFFFVWDRF
jgi:hypothetical protein